MLSASIHITISIFLYLVLLLLLFEILNKHLLRKTRFIHFSMNNRSIAKDRLVEKWMLDALKKNLK